MPGRSKVKRFFGVDCVCMLLTLWPRPFDAPVITTTLPAKLSDGEEGSTAGYRSRWVVFVN